MNQILLTILSSWFSIFIIVYLLNLYEKIMVSIEQEVFLRATPIPEQLIVFGFTKEERNFIYKTKFMDDMFFVTLTINIGDCLENFTVIGTVIDLDNNEEYLPLRNNSNSGSFTSKVRTEYIKLLKEIKNKCFNLNIFIYKQSNEINRWIQTKKNITPEFPWNKYPGNAIFRCSNNKWFAAILTVDYSKLDPKKAGTIEVINLKVTTNDTEQLSHIKGFFPAYHMNKKNWISIVLDETVSTDTIISFIVSSYDLVAKIKPAQNISKDLELSQNDWIILCNPNIYSVEEAFNKHKTILWKQTTKIHPGSSAYIYVGAPYSCILYKCLVNEVNIPYKGKNFKVNITKVMKISLVCKFKHGAISLSILRQHGINLLVGPRRMSKSLVEYIKTVKAEK